MDVVCVHTNGHQSGSLDSKKKTELGMRPILPSNLPISGIELIEKQIF